MHYFLSLIIFLTASLAHSEGSRLFGFSPFGPVHYQATDRAIDYVNSRAPKGGELHLLDLRGFQVLTPFFWTKSAQGISFVKPPLQFSRLSFNTLMTPSRDNDSALYALIAESVEFTPDGHAVLFHIDRRARFSDGSPITSDDVVFSILLAQDINPNFKSVYEKVAALRVCCPGSIVTRVG